MGGSQPDTQEEAEGLWSSGDLGPVSLKIFPMEFKFDGNLILLSPKF